MNPTFFHVLVCSWRILSQFFISLNIGLPREKEIVLFISASGDQQFLYSYIPCTWEETNPLLTIYLRVKIFKYHFFVVDSKYHLLSTNAYYLSRHPFHIN